MFETMLEGYNDECQELIKVWEEEERKAKKAQEEIEKLKQELAEREREQAAVVAKLSPAKVCSRT